MRAPQRAGPALARRTRKQLSDREVAVIESVERFRYLTARQIEDLQFYNHATPLTGARTCRKVLGRLTRASILWRLERRIGGVRAGSSSYVYGVAPFGDRILHHEGDARVRRREPSAAFLDHTLAVAQLVVDLEVLSRSGDLELIEVQTEPTCWRKFTVGLEGVQILKPDLLVSLRSGDFEYLWFVEVDLATHSVAAVIRKCWMYHHYWASGIEQDSRGLFPQMLFIAPSESRAQRVKRGIASARGLNGELFAVTDSTRALKCLTGGAS
jgi:hypothetical protein